MSWRSQAVTWIAVVMVGGCSSPPERERLAAVLVSQAALPEDCGTGLIRIFREDVGGSPDYGDIYQIALDEACRTTWQQSLAASYDWKCNSNAAHCVRGGVVRTDGKAKGYSEEWAEVRFLSAGLAQVELKKI